MFRVFGTVVFFLLSTQLNAGVKVTFAGVKFPMKVEVRQQDEKEVLTESGSMKFIGKIKVEPSSSTGYGYHVVYRIQNKSDLKIGMSDLEVKDGETIAIEQVAILAPKNGVLVPFKGGLMVLSALNPLAAPNPADYKGRDEFVSSAMFVAKHGNKKIAEKIAKELLQGGPEAWNHRSSVGFRIVRESKDGRVLHSLVQATQQELTEAIEAALLQLMVQGWASEVSKAKQMLALE